MRVMPGAYAAAENRGMPATFQTVRLSAGCHFDADDGVCVMELASMLAEEPFTDHPRCVSKLLAALLRGYNDALDDERRQALLPYASASVGTARGSAAERRRRRILRAWVAEQRGRRPRRWGYLDPTQTGLVLATRVRHHSDHALHERMCALFDALIAVGSTRPPLLVAPHFDRSHRVSP
jgi:hypothetical protein